MFGASGRERVDALYGTLDQPADTTALAREQAPGVFEGAASAPLTGAYRGWSRGASALANVATPALTPVARALDGLLGGSAESWLLGEQEKANRSLFESSLDPKTSGMAAQLLYGLGDVLTTVVGTGGNPWAAGGLYGVTQAGIGMHEGLDPLTATAKGTLEGIGLGVGVALAPAFGSVLWQKMISGATVNAGVGIATRAPVSVLLNARGYSEMAQQYAPLDATSIATDAVLGAAFGGFYRGRGVVPVEVPRGAVPPSMVDAALTASQVAHAEIDTAPGVPVNTRSRQAHTAALNNAVESLVMGRDVNVEGLLSDAGFLGKRPDFDALRIIAAEMEKAGAPDMVAKVRALEAEARSRGLVVEPDALDSVVLSDKPVEPMVAGAALRESQVKIGDQYVPTTLMLVEAGDVQATMGKAENQFRDRTRAASEQQIAGMAAALDPALLGDAPVMDYGAPVLAADGTVIGGNGRAAAVGRAYEGGTAQAYRDGLRAEFGEAVDGMQAPMLVRVLGREVDVQKAAILSNEGGGLRMSALEQAKVDAGRLGDLREFEFSEDGDPGMAGIRAWAAEMPVNQRAALMDADGRLSAEGAARLRNAILYRAYGDSPTLARLVEATDPGSRNIAAALTRVAPLVADAREAIERGDLYPLGLHDDLVSAVEKIDALRRSGLTVGDWAKQIDAFGDGMTAEARVLVAFLDRNIRGARQMADGIAAFYERLREAGSPKQGSMFEAALPDKGRMLDLAMGEPAPMYSRGAAEADPHTAPAAALLEIGRDQSLYQYPKSNAKGLAEIAADKAPGMKVEQESVTQPDGSEAPTGNWNIVTPAGDAAVLTVRGGEVWINVAGLKEGGGGSLIYDLAANFALNNGLRFIGDPAGLSPAAMVRRAEIMLSSAVKYGTTDHLAPHPKQLAGNKTIPAIKWEPGATLLNIRSLIDATVAANEKLSPATSDIRYDAATRRFLDSEGQMLGADGIAALSGIDRGEAGVGSPGEATVRRNALFRALLSGADERRALLGQLRGLQGDGGADAGRALAGSFYGRGAEGRSTAADLTAHFRAQFGRDADRLLEAGSVRIVQSVRDLPGSGHPADVGGMYWRGESYIVADNTSLAQIRGRVLHEVGEHAGMEQMLGADLYARTMADVERKAGSDPVFKEARKLAEARANRPEQVPAETLAYLIENAPELPVVRRVLAAVRQWVYRATGGRFVDLTQADLQMMALASLRRVAVEYPTRESVEAFYAGVKEGKPADPVQDTTLPDAPVLAAQADAESTALTELSKGALPAVECAMRAGE